MPAPGSTSGSSSCSCPVTGWRNTAALTTGTLTGPTCPTAGATIAQVCGQPVDITGCFNAVTGYPWRNATFIPPNWSVGSLTGNMAFDLNNNRTLGPGDRVWLECNPGGSGYLFDHCCPGHGCSSSSSSSGSSSASSTSLSNSSGSGFTPVPAPCFSTGETHVFAHCYVFPSGDCSCFTDAEFLEGGHSGCHDFGIVETMGVCSPYTNVQEWNMSGPGGIDCEGKIDFSIGCSPTDNLFHVDAGLGNTATIVGYSASPLSIAVQISLPSGCGGGSGGFLLILTD